VQLTAGQMLAYHTALALGRNIDKPRALAKSVTVA
jgi:glucosamine--fructose-6-phosphate aminotransferase (isomerizing)